jgi:hypothetical protein
MGNEGVLKMARPITQRRVTLGNLPNDGMSRFKQLQPRIPVRREKWLSNEVQKCTTSHGVIVKVNACFMFHVEWGFMSYADSVSVSYLSFLAYFSAGLAFLFAFMYVRLTSYKEFELIRAGNRTAADNLAAGIFSGALSLAVGLLNAASMSY